MEIPIPEIMSAGGAILATSIGFSKMFFTRMDQIETKLTKSIDKLNNTVSELDKQLAVNSCIIEKFIEEHNNGRHKRD